MLSKVTAFRNPNGPESEWSRISVYDRKPASLLRIGIAQAGYIAIVPFAIVEAALSLLAKLFSTCLPMSRERHDAMTLWAESSVFGVAWASCNAIINIFCNDMIQTERIAKICAARVGNALFSVPPEALVP